MMGYGMLWIGLLWLSLLLGFSYIIWTLALKETGNVKMTGQIIAGGIAVLTVIIFLLGAVWGGAGCPMMGGGMMDGQKGMMKMDGMKMGKDAKMMHKMMREGEQK